MEVPRSNYRRCYCCTHKLSQSAKRLTYTPSDGQGRSTSAVSRRSNTFCYTNTTNRDSQDYHQTTSSVNMYNKIRYDKRWNNNVPEFRYNVPSNYSSTFPLGDATRATYIPVTSKSAPSLGQHSHTHASVANSVVDVDSRLVEKQFYAAPRITDNQDEIEEKCRRWVETLPERFSGLNTVISLPALTPEYRN